MIYGSKTAKRYMILKQYSEISGRLKHPFSLTPIDRYSLGKLMFKIFVGYDFTLAMRKNMNYTSPLNTVLSFLFPEIEIKNLHRSAYFVKPFCRSPIEVRLVQLSSFRMYNKISMCGEKCTPADRLRGSLNIPLSNFLHLMLKVHKVV